jgi:hypothetical protein
MLLVRGSAAQESRSNPLGDALLLMPTASCGGQPQCRYLKDPAPTHHLVAIAPAGQPHKPASATDGAETGCATITHVDSGRVANQREGSCAEQSESQQPSASSASGAGSRSNSQEQQGASAQDEARSVPDMDDF